MKNFNKKFLTNTDETGRFNVSSFRTGRKYYVEPIGDPHIEFGSIDPANGKLTNKKGWKKFKGSVEESESLITKENGFTPVTLKPGQSPMDYINMIDAKYPDKE